MFWLIFGHLAPGTVVLTTVFVASFGLDAVAVFG